MSQKIYAAFLIVLLLVSLTLALTTKNDTVEVEEIKSASYTEEYYE